MTEPNKAVVGKISWIDLTVTNAVEIQDFYTQVIGWEAAPHNMGDYDDFDIKSPEDNEIITGICHARDTNVNIPPQWLVYINVENVNDSAKRCVELGGEIIDGPRTMGANQFCVIQDPAGAVAGLISPL